MHRMNEEWLRRESLGQDLVVTAGELYTNPEYHGPSSVAGETRFVLDIRSTSEIVLREMGVFARQATEEIARDAGVRFDLGRASYSQAAVMDPLVRDRLMEAGRQTGVPAIEMSSGAGHDAVVFANAGIPTGMIFIRNHHGSHNPDEAMDMEDFRAACRLLSAYLVMSFS